MADIMNIMATAPNQPASSTRTTSQSTQPKYKAATRQGRKNFDATLDKANAKLDDVKQDVQDLQDTGRKPAQVDEDAKPVDEKQTAQGKSDTPQDAPQQDENLSAGEKISTLPTDKPKENNSAPKEEIQTADIFFRAEENPDVQPTPETLPATETEIPDDKPKVSGTRTFPLRNLFWQKIFTAPENQTEENIPDGSEIPTDKIETQPTLPITNAAAYLFATSADLLATAKPAEVLTTTETPKVDAVQKFSPAQNLMSLVPQADDNAREMLNMLGGRAWRIIETPPAQLTVQNQSVEVQPQLTVQNQPVTVQPQLTVQNQLTEVQPQLPVQNQLAEVQPQLPVQNQPVDVQPQLTVQNQLAEVQPQFTAQNQPVDVQPQLPVQNQPADVQPQLTVQNQSVEVQPQLTIQNQLAEVQPQLTIQNQSAEIQPQLPVQNQPVEVQPQLPVQNQPAQVQPQLTVQNQPAQVQPQLTVQNQPVEVQPQLTVQNQPAQVQPQLTVQNQPVEVQPQVTVQNQPVTVQPQVTVQNQPANVQPQLPVQNQPVDVQPQAQAEIQAAQPIVQQKVDAQPAQILSDLLGVNVQVEESPISAPVTAPQSTTQQFEQETSQRDAQNFQGQNFTAPTEIQTQPVSTGGEIFAAPLATNDAPQTQPTAPTQNIDAPPPTPQDDFDVPAQIVRQARLIRTATNTEMVIKLNPEHLGELTLRVSVSSSGAVNASFHSDNAQVRTIIENSLVQLRQELNNAGLKVDNVEVSANLNDGGLMNGQGGQAWQQNRQQRQGNRRIAVDALEREIDSATPANENSAAEGVDYSV